MCGRYEDLSLESVVWPLSNNLVDLFSDLRTANMKLHSFYLYPL